MRSTETTPNYSLFPCPALEPGHVLMLHALLCFAMINLPFFSIGRETPECRVSFQIVVSSSPSMGPGPEGHFETLWSQNDTNEVKIVLVEGNDTFPTHLFNSLYWKYLLATGLSASCASTSQPSL